MGKLLLNVLLKGYNKKSFNNVEAYFYNKYLTDIIKFLPAEAIPDE